MIDPIVGMEKINLSDELLNKDNQNFDFFSAKFYKEVKGIFGSNFISLIPVNGKDLFLVSLQGDYPGTILEIVNNYLKEKYSVRISEYRFFKRTNT